MNFWTENGRTDSTHSKTRKCQKKGNRSKHCFWHYFQLKLHLWGPHTLGEFLRKEKTWRNYFILDGGGIPNKWHALFQYIKIPSGSDFRRSFSLSWFQNYNILKGKSDFPKFRKKTLINSINYMNQYISCILIVPQSFIIFLYCLNQ